MYFWKIKLLKDDIRNDVVTESDNLKYLLSYSGLTVLLLLLAVVSLYNTWGVGMVVVQILVVIVGTYYSFHTNGARQGKDFAKRFFSVGWIFLVRSLFFMFIGMLNLVFMTYLFSIEEMLTEQNTMIIALLFELLLYWRIGRHIASLSDLAIDV